MKDKGSCSCIYMFKQLKKSRHIHLFEKHQDIATDLELKGPFRYKEDFAME